MPPKGLELLRKGVYAVTPSQLKETDWLRKGLRDVVTEHGAATEEPAARHASMQLGALEELLRGKSMARFQHAAEPTRGVVQVDAGGNIRGAATINLNRGKEMLSGLRQMGERMEDLTAPNYLEYIGVTSPEVHGRELIRDLQTTHGPELMFRVATPDVNVPKYERMGARVLPEFGEQDGMPMMYFATPVRDPAPKAAAPSGQLELFAGGGGVRAPSTNSSFGRLNDRQQMRRSDIEDFLNAWHQEASAKRANQEAWQGIPDDTLTTINRLSASPADAITAQRDRLNAIRAQSAESRARGESARGVDPMSDPEFAEHRARVREEMSAPAKLIGAGLGLAGGLAAPLMVPAAPVMSGAALNALGGALPNWLMSTPEGVAQDAVAGGAMGLAASRIHPLAAIPAALASYAATSTPDAEAGGGSVAGMAKRLAQRAMSEAGDVDAVMAPRGALSVVKSKGGNWLNGSVEGALEGLKRPEAGILGGVGHTISPETAEELGITALPEYQSRKAINSFIDKQLTRYVKNEMATPEDPIRALAERGVLHFTPTERGNMASVAARMRGGYPKLSNAATEEARRWEDIVDAVPMRASYRDHLPMQGEMGNEPTGALNRLGGQFAVDNPDALAYGWNRGRTPEDLGFSHLTDELANALNPESGLPRHLLLDPNSLPRVSVPQAVERVAQINAWRAAQKAEADALRANNAATRIHKEYAENNPQGLRWVELKHNPDAPLPEGWQEVRKPSGEVGAWYDPKGVTVYEDPRRQALQDALKYEGDTMGHCVGGYCEDVAAGRSRIYSLRDAKGQPHVTIEVSPPVSSSQDSMSKHNPHEWWATLDEAGRDKYGGVMSDELEKLPEYQRWLSSQPSRIVQIKGKQNRAPNEEYLPFVQDFVKSGKWSDVGDLQNSGLIRNAGKRAEALGPYSTEEELTRYLDQFPDQNFAHGGSANIAPYGARHGSLGVKGKGYFGALAGKSGLSTEITTEDESGEYPLMVPTLSAGELDILLAGQPPTEEVYKKARAHSDQRKKAGLSPFAEPIGVKYPDPRFAQGGPVNKNNPLSIEQLSAIIGQLRQEHINAA